jgi:hypothetical protein
VRRIRLIVDLLAGNVNHFFHLSKWSSFWGTAQSPVFSITANYSYADKEISEKTVIDLRSYKSTFMPDYSIEERLEILTEEIIKLNDNVKQLAG